MKYISLILIFLVNQSVFGQGKEQLQEILQSSNHFYTIKNRASAYFNLANEDSVINANLGKDNEFRAYQRWEWFTGKKLMPDGTIASPLMDLEAYNNSNSNLRYSGENNWIPIGQQEIVLTDPDGLGVVHSISFHPTNPNIMYAGTYGGGMWKSTTGGNNWKPIGDDLPICSVGSICVDIEQPAILYIVLAINLENGSGLGIYKSFDGGNTWAPTGKTSKMNENIVYNKLVMHPTKRNVLFSCQSDGLWKTNDGGSTWKKLSNLEITDIKFNPLNPNTIYFCTGRNTYPCNIYKSFDECSTFTKTTDFTNSLFLRIGLTKSDTNFVAALFTDNSNLKVLYKSNNGGLTYTKTDIKVNPLGTGGEFVVSPFDKNVMYAGFPTFYKSIDGGVSWKDETPNFLHSDTRYVAINPLNDLIYNCNDGGICVLDEKNKTWKNISNGLDIAMFYDLGLSQRDTTLLVGGTQDNGGRLKDEKGKWSQYLFCDGTYTEFHPNNDSILFASCQNGSITRSDSRTKSFKYIRPGTYSGTFLTPFLFDPNQPNIFYGGYRQVFRSEDNGNTWKAISNFNENRSMQFLKIAPSNSNEIIAGFNYINKYYITKNLGVNWDTFYPPVQGLIVPSNIAGFSIDDYHDNIIYTYFDGYVDGKKIYKSTDYGKTWENISYDIPNVPVYCMIQEFPNGINSPILYVGTSIGVFTKNASENSWHKLGNGLPNVHVMDLEIRKKNHKLDAATYGRGIWEIDLTKNTVSTQNITKDLNIKINSSIIENSINFHFNLPKTQSVQFDLIDVNGIYKYSSNEKIYEGNNDYLFYIPSQNDGLYFIQIMSEGIRKTFKVVVKN